MRALRFPSLAATLLFLTACVTINVYFPAAEAQEAAREFVEKVIGDEAPAPASESGGMAANFDWTTLLISSAYAQSADITIKTPAIQAIQDRMAQRFQTQLAPAFDSGALGFGRDGLLVVRDASAIALKDRAGVQQAVADDNRDRGAVYREIAVANAHAEWEGQIREIFAKQWIASARAGWWYQDAGGAWTQK
jgi:uncharacterized protein YdbL (DUF1318 family)